MRVEVKSAKPPCGLTTTWDEVKFDGPQQWDGGVTLYVRGRATFPGESRPEVY